MNKQINFAKLLTIIFFVISLLGISYAIIPEYFACFDEYAGIEKINPDPEALPSYCGLGTAVVTLPISLPLMMGYDPGIPLTVLPFILLTLACVFWSIVGFFVGSIIGWVYNRTRVGNYKFTFNILVIICLAAVIMFFIFL